MKPTPGQSASAPPSHSWSPHQLWLKPVLTSSASVRPLSTSSPAPTTHFLAAHGMVKGTMALTTAEQSQKIYARMGRALEMSGGSAANTMAGVASLGGTPAFIGKVGADKLGEIFRHEIEAARRGLPRRRQAHDQPAHRHLPHPGHARRPAHHEHVPGAPAPNWVPTTSTPK